MIRLPLRLRDEGEADEEEDVLTRSAEPIPERENASRGEDVRDDVKEDLELCESVLSTRDPWL